MMTSPTREDPLARFLSASVGGVTGLHARVGGSRWKPLVALWLVATAVFALGLVQKIPCHEADWPRGEGNLVFNNLCYSDIPFLYRERGFAEGNVAYIDSGDYPALEYPVLTGVFMQASASLTQLLTDGGPVAGSLWFFEITAVMLFGCLLVLVWATYRLAKDRSYDAMMVAAAPSIVLAGLINWDLFAVALTMCGLLAWSRQRPGVAGLLLGLATAAKFYPLLLLGPLLVLALRSARLRQFFATFAAAALAWALVNVPVMLLASDSWASFWTFNKGRGAEFGSLWYVLAMRGFPTERVNALSLTLFAACCVGIGLLAFLAKQRPRLAQLAFLTVAAFLIINKVYSPQYVLWLLPLLALARPRWRDWMIWQAAEAFYWAAVWLHIAGALGTPGGGPDAMYSFAVLVRIGATLYLCVLIIRDILRPAHDSIRREGELDDPSGGPFDGAPDAMHSGRRATRQR